MAREAAAKLKAENAAMKAKIKNTKAATDNDITDDVGADGTVGAGRAEAAAASKARKAAEAERLRQGEAKREADAEAKAKAQSDEPKRKLLTGGVAMENPHRNPTSTFDDDGKETVGWLVSKQWGEVCRLADLPALLADWTVV